MSRVKHKAQEVFKFDELDDHAKDKARDWFRQGNQDDNFWSESVIEDAKDILKHLGFYNVEIAWSGFWSQGDGASFTGSWDSSDCKPNAVIEQWIGNEELHSIANKFAGLLVRCKVIGHELPTATLTNGRGNYCHEGTVYFEFHHEDEDALPHEARDDYEEEITDASRDLMGWIYSTLETEYEYQNSDEVIDENIRCNEYEFTEEGEIA